ncbi:MAG: hypothetical protein WCG27_06975 [Pseudomonadota bacterium]
MAPEDKETITTSDTVGVGKEVLSYCSKCKLTLAHTIVNMKNKETIGKVTCKTCQSTHVYKDPSKVKAKKKETGMKAAHKQDSIADIWMEAVNKSKAKSQKYSMKSKFILGDIVDHPKFGPGVVDRLIDTDKIQVIFRHEIKTLIHNLK